MSQKSHRPRPSRSIRQERARASLLGGSGTSPLAQWRDGVGLALVPTLYGLAALVSGHAHLPQRSGWLTIEGGPARALGLAAIVFGACLHFHFFWGAHETLSRYSELAIGVGIVLFLALLGSVAYMLLA